MEVMRALTLASFGGLDALTVADVPDPTRGPGDVEVRVRAVALGPWDIKATEGVFASAGGSTVFPQVQGWDFAGETADHRRVLGFVAQPWMGVGSLVERLVVPAGLVAHLPHELDWAVGSSLPVSVLTARQLVEGAGVVEGDKVLVTGAAGMVGGFTVELALARGATVMGAVRDNDVDEALGLGAEATVGTGQDMAGRVKGQWPGGADVCLDTIGLAAGALACVRDGGRFITTMGDAVPEAARGVAPLGVQVQPDPEPLEALARQAARGELQVRVAETMPLDDFRRAYELVREGGLHGKVVLTL
jgi:NADPH2:quinone reductase